MNTIANIIGSISPWAAGKQAKALSKFELENIMIEAALFLVPEQGWEEFFHHYLEVRVINDGPVPVEIQAIVCKTNDKNKFPGAEKVFIGAGESNQSLLLQKRNDSLQENFKLKVSNVEQFESAAPWVVVTTKSGKVFQAAIDRETLAKIKVYETGELCAAG